MLTRSKFWFEYLLYIFYSSFICRKQKKLLTTSKLTNIVFKVAARDLVY